MLKREDILSMVPGRELDALVAEKVIGRRSSWTPYFPSIDIADGWEVIEKMKKRNWRIALNFEDDKWTALFYWDPNKQACEAVAGTAPEAICKAALLAVME
jgi:hypothetical protein